MKKCLLLETSTYWGYYLSGLWHDSGCHLRFMTQIWPSFLRSMTQIWPSLIIFMTQFWFWLFIFTIIYDTIISWRFLEWICFFFLKYFFILFNFFYKSLISADASTPRGKTSNNCQNTPFLAKNEHNVIISLKKSQN